MTTYVLKVNEKNISGKKLIEYLKSISKTGNDVELTLEDRPYNEDFVVKIKQSQKSKGTVIKTSDLWK